MVTDSDAVRRAKGTEKSRLRSRQPVKKKVCEECNGEGEKDGHLCSTCFGIGYRL